MKPKPTHADLAGSRYLALQRLARAQKRATAELLQLYVLESFLRRLIRSQHDERLVLKGGLLLAAFDLRRATRDVDLLALRTDNDPAFVERLVVEIASVDVDDGVVFLLDTITTGPIRDDDVYPGVRAVLEARLATARIKLSVDVNVGDPVVPAPIRTAVPVLLGDERIDVLAYPKSMAPTWSRQSSWPSCCRIKLQPAHHRSTAVVDSPGVPKPTLSFWWATPALCR